MKKRAMFLTMICSLFTAGCSHNVVSYSDGIGFETSMRPDSGNFGITLRYGKILSVTARENTEVSMTGAGEGGSADEQSAAKADSKVKMKIGPQITGYYVDALKAGASAQDLNNYTTQKEQ